MPYTYKSNYNRIFSNIINLNVRLDPVGEETLKELKPKFKRSDEFQFLLSVAALIDAKYPRFFIEAPDFENNLKSIKANIIEIGIRYQGCSWFKAKKIKNFLIEKRVRNVDAINQDLVEEFEEEVSESKAVKKLLTIFDSLNDFEESLYKLLNKIEKKQKELNEIAKEVAKEKLKKIRKQKSLQVMIKRRPHMLNKLTSKHRTGRFVIKTHLDIKDSKNTVILTSSKTQKRVNNEYIQDAKNISKKKKTKTYEGVYHRNLINRKKIIQFKFIGPPPLIKTLKQVLSDVGCTTHAPLIVKGDFLDGNKLTNALKQQKLLEDNQGEDAEEPKTFKEEAREFHAKVDNALSKLKISDYVKGGPNSVFWKIFESYAKKEYSDENLNYYPHIVKFNKGRANKPYTGSELKEFYKTHIYGKELNITRVEMLHLYAKEKGKGEWNDGTSLTLQKVTETIKGSEQDIAGLLIDINSRLCKNWIKDKKIALLVYKTFMYLNEGSKDLTPQYAYLFNKPKN